MQLGAEADAAQHVERLNRAGYRVTNVERKERKRSPAPPFTTSTLQQEAARKLGFSARKTMTLAQRLYEGVDLPGEGTVGLITYMRTDSLNIADTALREIAELVKATYGQTYALDEPRRYKTKSRSAQEAHEAVRPTSVLRTPELMGRVLEHDQLRLYRLIWQRTVATQVADARFNQVGIDIEALAQDAAGDIRYGLRATGQTLVFDGFIRIYKEGRDDQVDPDAESTLPELTVEQVLRMLEVLPEQHFTQPPPRFSEASLVKTLEELGIGRPSTYASIISTIQDRGYVRLEEKRFYPEDVGMVVTDKLIEHFPDVVDVNFTAHMEDELDDIAEGGIGWTQVLHEFNEPFQRALEKAEHSFERYEEELDELCPLCPKEGREPGKLQVKLGRFGKFIGCPNYPECRYIRNMDGSERPEPVLLDETCPECGVHKLQERVGRFGPFVGCSGYPECRYIRKDPPVSTGVTCPECHQGTLVERKNRFGAPFYSCDRYPECTLAVSNPPIKDHPCPQCGSLLLQRPKSVKCWNCGAELDLDFNVTKDGDVEAEAAVRAAKAAAREARAKKKKPARPKDIREEDRGEAEDCCQTQAGREAQAGGEEGAGGRRSCARRGARRTGGLAARGQHRRRGRRTPRNQVGDTQRPPDEPRLLPPAGGDDGVVARRLGRVRRGDVAGGEPVRDHHGGVRRRGRDDRQDASRDPLRAVRRGVRRPVRPQEDHDRGRRRARCALRHDGVRPSPRDHLPAVLRDRMLLAALDARPRRLVAQPGPEATARERELDRTREHVRDAPARRGGVRCARGDQQRDRLSTGRRPSRSCWMRARSRFPR